MSERLSYSLVLVTHNRFEHLNQLLSAVITYKWDYSHFIIVDNASDDATGNVIDQFRYQLGLDVIRCPNNIGHGAGLAEAFQFHARLEERSKFLVLLEDDSVPESDLVTRLLGLIGNSDFSVISSHGWLVSPGRRRKMFSETVRDIDFCLFDGAIIDADIFETVGFPVRNWFMMMDDFEYCHRLKSFGFRLGVSSSISHNPGHLGGGGRFTHATLWRGYYQARNHVFFVRRYPSIRNVLDFVLMEIKREMGCLLAQDRFKRIGLRWRGLLHGLNGRKGRTLNPITLKFEM